MPARPRRTHNTRDKGNLNFVEKPGKPRRFEENEMTQSDIREMIRVSLVTLACEFALGLTLFPFLLAPTNRQAILPQQGKVVRRQWAQPKDAGPRALPGAAARDFRRMRGEDLATLASG